MTNTEMLKQKIAESGKKRCYLAAKLGMSMQGLRNCIMNKAEFKASHINILCEELNITDLKEKEAVFFDSKVHKKHQRR